MSLQIKEIIDESGLRSVFPLMQQLRPHLADADEFITRWQRQKQDSYQIIALYETGEIAGKTHKH